MTDPILTGRQSNSGPGRDLPPAPRRFPLALLLIFVALAAGIIGAGSLYFRNYERHYRVEVEHQLSAITALKTDEIVQWRQERLGNGAVFLNNENFASRVRQYLETPEDTEAKDRLLTWLRQIRTAQLYDRVFLLDAQGIERAAFPDTPEPAIPHLLQEAPDIMRSDQVTFLDFHRDAPDRPIYLSVLVPIHDDHDGGRPLGLLVLRINPETYLYPLINRWPTPSRTAETLLVRREGKDVLFLSQLKSDPNSALTLHLPMDNPQYPAVKAALGEVGIVEGEDFRGEPVLADLRPVPDSPWFLVAKMDLAEIRAPIRERLVEIVVLVGVLLLSAGMGLGFVWRQQGARFYREQFETAEALRESEELYHRTLDGMQEGFQIVGRDWRYRYVNDAAARHGRRTKEQMLGRTMMEAYPGIEATPMFAALRRVMEDGAAERIENEFAYPDGAKAWFELGIQPAVEGVSVISLDITERKRAEEAIRRAGAYNRSLIESSPDPLVTIGPDGKITDVNRATEAVTGLARGELIGTDFSDYFTAPDKARAGYQKVFAEGEVRDYDLEVRRRDGHVTPVLYNARVYRDEAGQVIGVFAAARDVTERRRAEKALYDSNRELELRNKIANIFLTFPGKEMYREVLRVILETFDSKEGGFGYLNDHGALVVPAMTSAIWAPGERKDQNFVFPRETWGDSSWARALREKKTNFTNEVSTITGEDRIHIGRNVSMPIVCSGRPIGLIHLANKPTNYTEKDLQVLETWANAIAPILDARLQAEREESQRRQTEEQLRRTLVDLQRSNQELEQFAYVASHDLQEPLRMVGSFVQLLQRRYQGKLEPDADEFIQFAVDGANRMKAMIQDLLTFSRVETRGKAPEKLDANAVLGEALANLRAAIEESRAVITNEGLPEIRADESQIIMLFQNLIGNAVKFQGDGPPRVHVSARPEGDRWVFSVRDTGIGIDPQFAERIFVIFQRLHGRDEYQGTGIGLAICKKIVERHGGKIWVESRPGEGATFSFILPAG